MPVPHEDLTDEINALLNDEGKIDATKTNGRFSSSEQPSSEELGRRGQTDAEQCARWRRALNHSDVEQQTLAQRTGVRPRTVHYHAHGQCQHEVDEPPLGGDQR